MSLTWDDILNNRDTFADTMEIDLNGEKLTVGDARARLLPKGEYTKATQRLKEMEGQFAQTQQQAAYLQQQLQVALAQRGQPMPENQDELAALVQEYPGLAPVANRLRQTEEKLNQSLQRMQQHELVFNTNQHAQMYDRIRSQDAEFATDEGRNKLVNYALQNGIQRLDLAHQLLTRDRDANTRAEKARLEGIEEGKKAARTPTVFGGGRRTSAKADPVSPTNMREAEAAALADPEILAIFSESAT